jgi:hypothetical protein
LQRALAILLLLGFSVSLISPVLSADSESKLPSCCRRDGKHHCSMTNPTEGKSQKPSLALKGARAKCPLYPPGAMPATAKASASHPAFVLPAPAPSQPPAVAQPEARFHLSFSRACQKRGPPLLIS